MEEGPKKRYRISICEDAELDLVTGVKFVSSPKCGAIHTFSGTVRDMEIRHQSTGCSFPSLEPIEALHYEAYKTMLLKQLQSIAEEVLNLGLPDIEPDENVRVFVGLRLGLVKVGEASLVICVSSTRRFFSHQATMHILTQIKALSAVWKKAVFQCGQEEWADSSRSEAFWLSELQNIKQELSSYDKIMSLLKDHIQENVAVYQRLSNTLGGGKNTSSKELERKQAIVKESYDKLQAKYEHFRVAKLVREDDYKRQLADKTQLESHLNSMKTQIASIKKLQEVQENELSKQQHQQPTEPAFDYDVETINFLNECNWNLGDSCDRSLAEILLSCFPSGTFLIRSSKTESNSFALSVVANSVVRHILIDKVDEEYCFRPAGPQRQFYPSLCGLVMDYRHKSLLRHNPGLDTSLVYPVLSQLKKTSKGST